MIEAVVFDIGNVLIEWQPERYYDATIGPEARRAMFAEVDLHGMNDVVDRGGDFKGTIYDTAERYPQWRNEIQLWYTNWIEMACPVISRSVRLMRALRAKEVPVFALTNFGIGSFAYARTQYDFLNEFDRAWVSGHMGLLKPDPLIYEAVEADCGLTPSTLLFADDRAENIAAAASRGWQVHHFTGPEGWAARLVAEGLLNEKEAE